MSEQRPYANVPTHILAKMLSRTAEGSAIRREIQHELRDRLDKAILQIEMEFELPSRFGAHRKRSRS